MIGGAGDDVFVIDDAGDVAGEQVGEGIDLVRSSITLWLGSNLENLTLTLTGSADIDGFGNDLDNTLTGNSGINVLFGGDGNDVVDGGAGNDQIYGETGDDTLLGGDGNDGLFGWVGDDTLLGGNGNDSLYGDDGNDVLDGGDGNDTLYGSIGADIMDGGTGLDTVTYKTSTAGVLIDLATGVGYGGDAEGDVLINVETVIGSNYTDLLRGGSGNDTLLSGNGDDTIEGGDGADFLNGNNGNDIVFGGAGNDWVCGGIGDDTLFGGQGSDTLVFNGGVDVIDNKGHGADGDILRLNFLGSVDRYWFEQSADDLKISVIGTTDNVTISGWFADAANHLTVIEALGGQTLTDTAVQNLVTAMAAMEPPPIGQTTLTLQQHQGLDTVIAAAWH